jgi:hypothetical protein
MRLIDADATLRVVKKRSYTLVSKNNTIDQGMFLWGIEKAIKEMPTISPAANWTPCSVALPKAQSHTELLEEPNQYIVDLVYKKSYRHIVTTLAFGKLDYMNDVGWVNSEECYAVKDSGYTVLAWQPLPEPYRGEGE